MGGTPDATFGNRWDSRRRASEPGTRTAWLVPADPSGRKAQTGHCRLGPAPLTLANLGRRAGQKEAVPQPIP